MKHRTVILLALSLALSLACLAPVASVPTGAPVKITSTASDLVSLAAPTSGGAVASETPVPGVVCTKVTAVKALTLRAADGLDAAPVAWLLAGDIVHLVGAPAGDWWPVAIDGRVGYARSSYLVKVDCP